VAGGALADYKDDIGYTQLISELGSAAPDGSGVPVTQAEAATSWVDHDNDPATPDWPVYLPDPANAAFAGKLISDLTGADFGTYSGHATAVGRRFYGTTTSIAPQITAIDAFLADHWLQNGFLRYGVNNKPRASTSRVTNHSWVGQSTNPADDSDMLRRLDWVIETDEFIHTVGTRNNTGSNRNLLSAAYNAIAVGRTDGLHGTGTSTIDADYTAGRVRPELVAPLTTTSSATPVVGAAAALLVQTGRDNPGLSTDPLEITTTNRSGATIYNAERAEVVKAVLMAGADRQTSNTTAADITDYRVVTANQSANGLDKRFGAGQVNIYNSYYILMAGEQNSTEDQPAAGNIANLGFDYDPAFGGANGTNNVASYTFSTGTGGAKLYATLAWHIDIAGGNGPNFTGTATLHDLDLLLYDVTAAPLLVASSASLIDNTETLWEALTAGRDYRLQVISKGSFNWDYALAWRIEAVTDSDGDGDGVPDAVDNCPQDPNPAQFDNDLDGAGDVCDPDDDNDGTPDTLDAFPFDTSEDTDTDSDGIGNNADSDDDGDGFSDSTELALGYDALDALDAPEWGDLNNDGLVNAADVLQASRAALGDLLLSAAQQEVGRVAPLVNGQPAPLPGVALAAPDVQLITRKALGEISF
jgi:hypothetical protein